MLLRELKSFFGCLVINYPNTKLGYSIRSWYWSRVLDKQIGPNFTIGKGAEIGLKTHVKIGNNFIMGDFCTIAAGDSLPIYIGTNVSIAKNSYIRTANHQTKDINTPINQQGHTYQTILFQSSEYSIVIEDDVWIGANAIILSGAHIGRGSVIGAGAVVSSFVPDFSIALGNPARVISKRG